MSGLVKLYRSNYLEIIILVMTAAFGKLKMKTKRKKRRKGKRKEKKKVPLKSISAHTLKIFLCSAG